MVLDEDDEPSQEERTCQLKGRCDYIPEDGDRKLPAVGLDHCPIKFVLLVRCLIGPPALSQARLLLPNVILLPNSSQLVHIDLVLLSVLQHGAHPVEEQLRP